MRNSVLEVMAQNDQTKPSELVILFEKVNFKSKEFYACT